jgi:acetylornithine/succinyldiaminopimelate/putrescine aminotransferase/predicted amino acid dehydrogenase
MLFGHNHPSLVGILQDALVAHRPQFVQMSNRTAAGTLAKELVKRVAMLSGRDYKAILGSTGAEMVDAALKHALFEWTQRRDRFVSDCMTEEGEAPNAAGEPPVILAIEGSYHGKTLGAYSLTWNAPGRDDLRLSGPFEVIWLPRDDAAAAAEVFARYQSEVTTKTGAARFNRIAGLFVEPVQGEGGIFPLDKSFADTLRKLADHADCPIIVDEIQSGMGRTGAFTASSQIGLRGDYYIFGKSLGGGLTKIGALLIDSDRYTAGYGFAHTSTFGEDDHSALVGLGALRLLDDDNVEARAHDAGTYLINLLQDLKARFPDVISDVRGCGLMIGIELASQSDNASPVITGLSDQDLLGLFVASHLLHRREVRVGTALSRPMTLRLEPSAYISRADMDKTVAGIEAVCRIISSADAADLLRHLAQSYRKSGQTPFRVSAKHTSGRTKATTATTTRTGNRAVFLGHMIDSDDIGFWDKSLLDLSEPERENLAGRLVDPILVKQMTLLSPSAGALDFEIQSLPITSRAIVNALREGQSARIVEQVKVAVADFARQGASVVGLGGLLSVITRNGLAVGQDIEGLQITTGNTYTVALAAEAVIRTAREQHIDPVVDRIGIIGAGGNIGSTLVHILTEQFQHFHLVGRKQTIARVERVADAVYDAALATLQSCGETAVRGLAAAIAETKPYSQIFGRDSGRMNGAWLGGEHLSAGALLRQKIIEHYGTDPFLPVSPSIDALQNCSVIVTASNSIAPILTTSNVGPATKIICDISVPSDVDPLLSERRPDISMVRGGVARLSDDNQFTLDMLDLPENHMLACMAETALLGFAGKQGFEAIGDINASSVRECHELGHKLGFDLGYSSVEKPFAIELV